MNDAPVDINTVINVLVAKNSELTRELAIAHGTIAALQARIANDAPADGAIDG